MQVRRTEQVVVQTADYNQWKFEIQVGATHLDLGITDGALAEFTREQWDEKWGELNDLAKAEVDREIESFFERVEPLSENENLAIRYLNSKQASQQTSKRKLRRR